MTSWPCPTSSGSGRAAGRPAGLGDDEYLWEPVPGCWTVPDRGDGSYRVDGVWPVPEAAPFTTLAWRVAHLIDSDGADRNADFCTSRSNLPCSTPAAPARGRRTALSTLSTEPTRGGATT